MVIHPRFEIAANKPNVQGTLQAAAKNGSRKHSYVYIIYVHANVRMYNNTYVHIMFAENQRRTRQRIFVLHTFSVVLFCVLHVSVCDSSFRSLLLSAACDCDCD